MEFEYKKQLDVCEKLQDRMSARDYFIQIVVAFLAHLGYSEFSATYRKLFK